MEKAIHWIIDHLPKPLQKLWYDHESVWMYILMGGLTTVVSLVFQMLPTALSVSYTHLTLPTTERV